MKTLSIHHSLALAVTLLVLNTAPSNGSVVVEENFASSTPLDNPWSCVDGAGQIKAMTGLQLGVDSSGTIGPKAQAPSVAIGDLNGDGLPDLVFADSRGFFWYFQNHGTSDAPKFTTGELMPIWLGDPPPENPWHLSPDTVVDNVVPRIQLVDLDGSGKLDLVAGNFLGELFYIRNQGTTSAPAFRMPSDLADITVPTHRHGTLWCNYLAPCLADWEHRGVLDLLIGDGTYSANSIYLLKNKGSSDQPTFTEDNTAKIIPGMGREMLVPQAVAWNGDTKPSILTAEREGHINLFLNQGNDATTGLPNFDQGTHLLLGDHEQLFPYSTVFLASLTAKGLPGLTIGAQDGHIWYAPNTGTATDFKFGAPQILKATDIRPQILKSTAWHLWAGWGSPYDQLVCTNPQVEPGFTPPPNSGINTALKFYIDEPAKPNPTFHEHFYPKIDTREIQRNAGVTLNGDTDYKISFWVRTTGNISNFTCNINGYQYQGRDVLGWIGAEKTEIGGANSWTQITDRVHFASFSEDRHAAVGLNLYFEFNGTGSIYLSQLKLETQE